MLYPHVALTDMDAAMLTSATAAKTTLIHIIAYDWAQQGL